MKASVSFTFQILCTDSDMKETWSLMKNSVLAGKICSNNEMLFFTDEMKSLFQAS